jgi:isoquinoline 1-oxidoreductase subunit beta
MNIHPLTRRDFLKVMAGAGGGLVLAVYLDACTAPTETPTAVAPTATKIPPTMTPTAIPSTATPTPEPPSAVDWEPSIYIKVDHQGLLTVTAFRSEMGQGIRTALAMLVAEELDVDWGNVRIEQALADGRYGDQLTGGSVSVSTYHNVMRRAGATARQMLINAAAHQWNAEAEKCTTTPGFVIHPNGQDKLAYGDLVDAAAKIEKPNDVKLKEPDQFRILDTAIGHWDAPQIVSGKVIYGLDVRLPGMLFAALARCPVFGGEYTDYDDAEAKTIPGVKQVVVLDRSLDRYIAVVAENSWAAIRGRNALKVTWDEGANATLDSQEMMKSATAQLKQSNDSNVLGAIYEMPYEAHATMEPMNCTAHVHDGICEVWAPTQSPQDVQRAVAGVLRMSPDKVTVHVPLIGGGFGRRLQVDYAQEAALVSKAINAPVQIVWTRDDDLQHDFYQPLLVQYAHGRLDKPDLPIVSSASGTGVPTGAWRSVENFPAAYANQCYLDELAYALKRDPLDLRLEIYSSKYALGVIKLAAEKAGWGTALPAGQGRGLAYHATFGVTHVCDVAEVEVDSAGNVRVKRIVCAVDCGRVVNPDNVKAQMEGGIAFGLTATLKAEATVKNGRIQQSNFNDYPLLRMDEMPVIEVYIVESDQEPTGIGEMGVPPVAPAIANAVFAATGKRIRHIPIRPADLKA